MDDFTYVCGAHAFLGSSVPVITKEEEVTQKPAKLVAKLEGERPS